MVKFTELNYYNGITTLFLILLSFFLSISISISQITLGVLLLLLIIYIIDKKYKPTGYNIGINCGVSAGQTVMHVHVHLIPRYDGDVKNPKGGVRGVIPEKRDYTR